MHTQTPTHPGELDGNFRRLHFVGTGVWSVREVLEEIGLSYNDDGFRGPLALRSGLDFALRRAGGSRSWDSANLEGFRTAKSCGARDAFGTWIPENRLEAHVAAHRTTDLTLYPFLLISFKLRTSFPSKARDTLIREVTDARKNGQLTSPLILVWAERNRQVLTFPLAGPRKKAGPKSHSKFPSLSSYQALNSTQNPCSSHRSLQA